MRIFRFDATTGRPIEQFGSVQLHITPIQRIQPTSAPIQMICMHLGAAGIVGYHQATCPQLFLVVQGEGWVRGETEERRPIHAGLAAFWQTDEWHAAGSDTGMTAIVLEGDTLVDPGQFMPEASEEPGEH